MIQMMAAVAVTVVVDLAQVSMLSLRLGGIGKKGGTLL
jgi:hypothetical protein